MIAVVDHKAKAVWGLGDTREAAMVDARHQIAGKPTPPPQGQLEYCNIKPDAPFHLDGETLYEYCLVEQVADDEQMRLF